MTQIDRNFTMNETLSASSPRILWMVSVLAIVLMFTACSSGGTEVEGAVPLGSREALEKLAASYEEESRRLMSSPATLAPQERKAFVRRVFTGAGYDYDITLQTLARGGLDNRVQYHHDLVELLFLPHLINRLDQLPDIYTQEEMMAIEQIKAQMK